MTTTRLIWYPFDALDKYFQTTRYRTKPRLNVLVVVVIVIVNSRRRRRRCTSVITIYTQSPIYNNIYIYIGRRAYNILLWYSGARRRRTDRQTDRRVHLSRVCLNNNNNNSSVIRSLFSFWTARMRSYV